MKLEYLASVGCFAFAIADYAFTDFGVLAWVILGAYFAADAIELSVTEEDDV